MTSSPAMLGFDLKVTEFSKRAFACLPMFFTLVETGEKESLAAYHHSGAVRANPRLEEPPVP